MASTSKSEKFWVDFGFFFFWNYFRIIYNPKAGIKNDINSNRVGAQKFIIQVKKILKSPLSSWTQK